MKRAFVCLVATVQCVASAELVAHPDDTGPGAGPPFLLAERPAPNVDSSGGTSAGSTDKENPLLVNGLLPGSLKRLPDSDAVRDAAGKGQLFEAIHVPHITDFREGYNGFAIVDLDKNGFLDLLVISTIPFALDALWNDQDGTVERTRDPRDRIRILLNQGNFYFEPHEIVISGSAATPNDFSQGWRGGQVPGMADFNNDGLLDLYVSRQPPMTKGEIREGYRAIGNSFMIADGNFFRFKDISVETNARNELAYNRQVAFGDVNKDGFLDVAVGGNNMQVLFEGLPKSALLVYQPNDGEFEGGKFRDVGGTDVVPDFGGYYRDSAKDKAGPNIVLRDVDNDGAIDLLQSYMAAVGVRPPPRMSLEYGPGEYRQGVFNWRNVSDIKGTLQFEKITENGLANEARAKYDWDKKMFVPATDAKDPGLPYLSLGDVTNNGYFDVITVGMGDAIAKARMEPVAGRFWYNLGNFQFKEATSEAGLDSLNQTYGWWYEFYDAPVSDQMRKRVDYKSRLQPGLDLGSLTDWRPYWADAIFGDYNNDSWLDFVVLDRWELNGSVEVRGILYMNKGNGVFEPQQTSMSGIDHWGIAGEAADLNNDGLLDLIVSSDPDNTGVEDDIRNFEAKVYMNTGEHGGKANHWLRLRFSGISHAELIGARVEVFDTDAGKRLGTRGIYAQNSYKTGVALEAHFGLAKNKTVDVLVSLFNGKETTLNDVLANRFYELDLQTGELTEVRASGKHSDPYPAAAVVQ